MSTAIEEVTMELNERLAEKSLQVHSKKCHAHVENFFMQEYCKIISVKSKSSFYKGDEVLMYFIKIIN